MSKCPCDRNCPDRTATCKRTCPEWADYEEAQREKQKEKDKEYRKKLPIDNYYADKDTNYRRKNLRLRSFKYTGKK